MSWSFSGFGKPDAVVREIEKANFGLTGQSKDEWEEAKPALLTLVKANVGNNIAVKLDASGSASYETKSHVDTDSRSKTEGDVISTERIKMSGNCSVVLSTLYGLLE